MAIDPLSAGLSAVSLISGKNSNKKAQSTADKAQKSNKRLEDRAVKLFDVLFSGAEKAVQSGVFDPERKIAQLEKDTGEYESRDLGNLAGALTTAGYQPGDSEIGVRLDAVKGKYRKFLDTMREEIRSKSFFEQQQAYQSANPSYLQPAIQGNNQTAQNALASQQNPAGFLANLLPSLMPTKANTQSSKPVNWSFMKNFGQYA